ncbi:MAG: hypothetical protein U5K54_03650 [Cytophagales bacterium]|nr:hypothetical protein [Cytophagales bacterium]
MQDHPTESTPAFVQAMQGISVLDLLWRKMPENKFGGRHPSNKLVLIFFSFHAQVLNKGKFKNLIVGDYQAQFGQGLILGSAFGIGKSAEAVTTIRRPNIGFMPYSSLYRPADFEVPPSPIL